ncbi:MATE family efflux transporter [Paludicola sp. MB14-C6]|uniref:MATE family efflux transporter n=1 Tax=Paludihabitans sp. MB14-C6 TaxID=3070656 RepID=UPI0027DD1C4D|nr:MATE family efflux transporter [Paludicola sp. MB14-C6]WMJ22145.1 MATE family efflux transporter [Paludicola sp. MB14-C6]
MKKITNDLGNDSIGKLLLRLAIPAIAAQLINALYNIVDRIYIGNIDEVGKVALTGVGVTFPIIMIISAFSALIGMGGAPKVAIKLGEGNKEEAEHILGNCFITLMGVSIILTAVFLIWGRDMLMLFGASENTIEYALSYLNIYVLGTIFVQLSMGLNSFISTQGFAKTAMLTVLIGAILNIVLDPIFIFAFNMGVKGAAIATVISQAVSAIWVVKFLLSSESEIRIRKKYFRLNKAVMLPVLALGLSPFIMQSTESLVNIALNSSLQRFGGDDAVGAMTIIGSVIQFCIMPLAGLASSAQPIIGFNFGARKVDRVKKTFRYLLISAIVFSILMWGCVMVVPQMFVRLFASDAALMDITVWAMRIFMSGVFMLGIQFACQQTFVALGQAKVSLLLALLRKIILLIPLIYILPFFFTDKVLAVLLSEPIADVIAATVTGLVFIIKFKKILKARELEDIDKERIEVEVIETNV